MKIKLIAFAFLFVICSCNTNDRKSTGSTNNETTIQRILSGGLTVYLNNHGVKDEPGAAGISFPTGNMSRQANKMMNDRPEYRNNKHVALDAVQDYSLFGFNTIKTQQNFDYGKTNAEGIEVSIG